MATANNKKPAPAARPTAAKTPVQAAAKETEKDIDDLEDEGGKGDFNKLPVAKRVAVRLGNEVNRLTKQFDLVSKWPDNGSGAVTRTKERLGEVLDGLKSACEALASLPDDYKPRVAKGKGGGGKVDLLPGSMIRITDKRIGEYDGVLEPEQMRGIKVVEVRGNKVVALTNDGVKCMLARGHVCPDVG
jgi:hypothetical protein